MISWQFFASLIKHIRKEHFDSYTTIIISVQNSHSAYTFRYTPHTKGGGEDRILRELKEGVNITYKNKDKNAHTQRNGEQHLQQRNCELTTSESVRIWKRRKGYC